MSEVGTFRKLHELFGNCKSAWIALSVNRGKDAATAVGATVGATVGTTVGVAAGVFTTGGGTSAIGVTDGVTLTTFVVGNCVIAVGGATGVGGGGLGVAKGVFVALGVLVGVGVAAAVSRDSFSTAFVARAAMAESPQMPLATNLILSVRNSAVKISAAQTIRKITLSINHPGGAIVPPCLYFVIPS